MSRLRLASTACLILLLPSACVAEYQAIPDAADETTEATVGETVTVASTEDASTEPVDGSSGELICPEDQDECDGECVEIWNDPDNCGGCGEFCIGEAACVEEECLVSCDEGCEFFDSYCVGDWCICRPETINCAGECINPRSNPEHCGDCGEECPPERPVCAEGECIEDCADYPDECGGGCTDVESDPFHCGGCEQPCEVGATCVSADCVPFAQLDPVQCDECPCDELCAGTCCSSDFFETKICVEGSLCPGD